MEKEIRVTDKDNNQYVLHKDGTYSKVKNFKIGDTFKFIKEWGTSEGTVQKGDIFTITQVWKNDKDSHGVYWIKCLNRKRDKSIGREGEDWIMGTGLMDFNNDCGTLFVSLNREEKLKRILNDKIL